MVGKTWLGLQFSADDSAVEGLVQRRFGKQEFRHTRSRGDGAGARGSPAHVFDDFS